MIPKITESAALFYGLRQQGNDEKNRSAAQSLQHHQKEEDAAGQAGLHQPVSEITQISQVKMRRERENLQMHTEAGKSQHQRHQQRFQGCRQRQQRQIVGA